MFLILKQVLGSFRAYHDYWTSERALRLEAEANKTVNREIHSAFCLYGSPLYDADPNCGHEIQILTDGIACSKCSGWFCY